MLSTTPVNIKPLFELLSKLDELYVCTGSKDYYLNLYSEYLPESFSRYFLKDMLDKLVKEGVLSYEIYEDNRNPYRSLSLSIAGVRPVYYKIKLDASFEVYYKKVRANYLRENEKQETSAEDIAYQIKYNSMTSEITCNNFLLSKPQYESVNDVFFRKVYANPNREVNISDVVTKGKSIHKILDELGFRGDLRKIFFKANKNTVVFNNPVKISVLKIAKLYPIKLALKGMKDIK
jgi:hypothetical protein